MAGRPEIPIDWKFVDRALEAGCTQKEIAGYLGIHDDTLRNRLQEKYGVDYSTYSTAKYCAGDSLLKLAQFQKALNSGSKGNSTMLMFLGKHRLGQKDNIETDEMKPEILDKFTELMALMQRSQSLESERKMADNNNNEETKS